ncbi:MAG: LysM peptidoglycan-binding domain-containing protein [Tepidisphaera sp.]|nr:LysM peptidoglycan-binding domain-containing protein [Tepidisphaera sp.]
MQAQSGRIAGFVALLAVLWIVVYWGWPAGGGKISFASKPGPAATSPNAAPTPPGPKLPVKAGPVLPLIDPKPAMPAQTQPREPQPPIAVVPPQFIEHTVRPSETLSSISSKYFGSTSHVEAILRANPYLDPRRLRPGRVIKIPKDPDNIQGKPVDPAPDPANPGAPAKTTDNEQPAPREYVVQSGDTLSGIASEIYGTSAMAHAIYEANRDVMTDEDSLRVGLRLKLPPKGR